MKNPLFPALLLLSAQFCAAQVRTDTAKRVLVTNRNMAGVNLKTIPAARAVIVRRDVATLKLQLSKMSDSIAISKREIDAIVDKMKGDIDSMSEMGETESLRLQMAMDRLSKMMSALSNIMKKISDTGQQITQNIK